jgi:DNA processing protein
MMPPDHEFRDLVALTLIPGLGPRLTQALIDHYGSPSAARRATPDELMDVPHIGTKLAREFAKSLQSVDVDAELELARKHNVTLIPINSPDYPEWLKSIANAPHILYAKGTLLKADSNAIGIVGSRQCSAYGQRIAQQFAAGLARAGYTIISGLALGIDGCAHRGALEGGGRTIAVLAGGLSGLYPPQHIKLAEQVVLQGALVTETPMPMEPQRGMFHARNRIISGLSRAIVIIEANDRSGALITARHAAEQGREVFALPANVDSTYSAGSLRLLRDGAKLIRSVDDLLEDLKGLAPLVESSGSAMGVPQSASLFATPVAATPSLFPAAPPPTLDANQLRIWESLDEPKNVDELTRLLEIPVSEMSKILFGLEMKKVVQRMPGNIYARR